MCSKVEITTFQEINDLIYKDTNLLIKYFEDHPHEIEFMERKNPLCLESMRDYLLRLFRVVSNVTGNLIKNFITNLKAAFRKQVEIVKTLTQKTADVGLNFITQHQFKSFVVYNYSRSVAVALKQLSKIIGQNL